MMIDPELSLFEIANDWQLRRLFANYRGALKNISYQIEEAVVTGGIYTRIFAGFQKFSYFLPRIERYHELARTADGVWVFGIPDVEVPPIPGVKYVPLSERARLVEEWFLVVDSPEYFSALTAQDLTGFDIPNPQRRFRGIWTFDDALVARLQQTLSEALNLPPLPEVSRRSRNYRRQLHQLSMSAGKLVDMLERRNQQLSQAQQMREDLNHMLVHDMRNPLTSIVGSLDLLDARFESMPPDKISAFLRRAANSSRLLSKMIDDLLDIAKLEEGKLTLSREAVDPALLVEQTANLFRDTAARSDLQIEVNLPETLPAVWAEGDKLMRVLGNLVSNAVKYADSLVALGIEDRNGQVCFAVQDDGPGIPPEAQEHIFEKFQQAGGDQQRHGTGLGLTFCRLIVEVHGGQIWLESEPGQGTTFFFTIPVR